MITIDTSLLFDAKNFIYNTRRKNQNAYSNIDKFSDEHAVNGTPKYLKPASVQELKEIITALKLDIPKNRFSILLLLPPGELFDMLSLIEPEKLLLGLKFFNKEKIINYLALLPKEDLIKMLLHKISKEKLLKLLPMKMHKKFLESKNLPKDELMKVIMTLPRNILVQLIEFITGESVNNDIPREELAKKFTQFDKTVIVEGLKSLPPNELTAFITKLILNNEELLKEYPKMAFMKELIKWQKSDIIESMIVLDPEKIINLLGELPADLLANVVTLMDQDELTARLLKYHANLLSSIAA